MQVGCGAHQQKRILKSYGFTEVHNGGRTVSLQDKILKNGTPLL
jgi:hypothetical protein